MDRFVHTGAITQACTGQQTDAACDGACFVTQNITEDIVGEDYVKLFGVEDKLHCFMDKEGNILNMKKAYPDFYAAIAAEVQA